MAAAPSHICHSMCTVLFSAAFALRLTFMVACYHRLLRVLRIEFENLKTYGGTRSLRPQLCISLPTFALIPTRIYGTEASVGFTCVSMVPFVICQVKNEVHFLFLIVEQTSQQRDHACSQAFVSFLSLRFLKSLVSSKTIWYEFLNWPKCCTQNF